MVVRRTILRYEILFIKKLQNGGSWWNWISNGLGAVKLGLISTYYLVEDN